MVRCSDRGCIRPTNRMVRGVCARALPFIPIEPSACRNVANNTNYAINANWSINPLAQTLAECAEPCIASYLRQTAYLIACPIDGKAGQCCISNNCCCVIDFNGSWQSFGEDELIVIREGTDDPNLLRLCVDVNGRFDPIQPQGHIQFSIDPCARNLSADVTLDGAFIQTPLRGDNTCFGYVEAYTVTLRGDPLFICQNELIGEFNFRLAFIECICLGTSQPPPPPSEEGWENTKEDSEVLLGLTLGSMAYEDMFDMHMLRQIRVR